MRKLEDLSTEELQEECERREIQLEISDGDEESFFRLVKKIIKIIFCDMFFKKTLKDCPRSFERVVEGKRTRHRNI